ncbi:MAG: cyclic nucleotide-binding domain-containing protein [Bacillota bacterium]
MERIVEFKKGCYIYMINSLSLKCYILKKGQVVLKSRELGRIWVQEGALFGLSGMISGERHRESAYAQTNCQVVELDRESIKNYILENKEFREAGFSHLVEYLKMANRKIEAKSIHSDDNIAQKIYDAFLYYYSDNKINKAYELFERLEKNYKNTSYYKKALIYLNEFKCEEQRESSRTHTMYLIDALLRSS